MLLFDFYFQNLIILNVWIPIDLDEILCQIASPDDEQMAVRCLIIQPRLVVLYAYYYLHM